MVSNPFSKSMANYLARGSITSAFVEDRLNFPCPTESSRLQAPSEPVPTTYALLSEHFTP
jgi:hypothetical protein